MDTTGLLVFIAIGVLVGWLAGVITKGGGSGLVGNIIIGIVGGVLGGVLFRLLAITAGGFLGAMLTATLGAVALLLVVAHFKKKETP